MEDKIFALGKSMVTLSLSSNIIENIDVDDTLKMDFANILGEILTFPVILNQLGELLVEVEDILRKKTLQVQNYKEDLDAFRGQIEMVAFSDLQKGDDTIKREAIKSPTIAQIAACLNNNKEYKDKLEGYRSLKMECINIEKDAAYIRNLYWAAKSKDDKLNKMTDKLSPNEFVGDIVDGVINGINIKVREKLIKDIK